jgi:hypothetical protein
MFRFTIRELVLLTLLAAMGVRWWVERTRYHRLNSRYDRLVSEVEGWLPMRLDSSGELISPRQWAERQREMQTSPPASR